jgi:hypothetical protein
MLFADQAKDTATKISCRSSSSAPNEKNRSTSDSRLAQAQDREFQPRIHSVPSQKLSAQIPE